MTQPIAFRLVRKEPTREQAVALGVGFCHGGPEAAYNNAISNSPSYTEEEIDQLCRAYSSTGIRAPEVEEWWEPETKHMHRDKLRNQDRARMKRFLSIIGGQDQ